MKKLILLFCALGMAVSSWGYDFTSGGIYYSITSTTAKTVAVTYATRNYNSYSGSVTIPSTVTNTTSGITYSVDSIGDYAFYNCSLLTSISLPSSIKTIGMWAFGESRNLKSIIIPTSVTSIGERAFYNCYSLTSVSLSSIKIIENDVFSGCYRLTSINIPTSVTTIKDEAFQGCTGLTSINFPPSLTSIGVFAFNACTGLTSITLPLANICSAAFCGCSGLTSITIPSEVEYLSQALFASCTSLTDIYNYQTTPMSMESYLVVFSGDDTTKCTLHVPKGTLAAYKAAYVWKGFTHIVDDLSASGITYAQNSAAKVTVRNGQAVITGTEAGTALSVYNLQGTAIYTGKTSGETESIALPGRGVYIVLLGGKSVKVIY